MNYKGQLTGFPQEVVEKMLERQFEQTKKRDVEVFERLITLGFVWNKTIEGGAFWSDVINNKNFDLFFERYPKPPTYPKVMWVSDDEDFERKIKRVVFMEKDGYFIAWNSAKTIKDAERILETVAWRYAKDIIPEDEFVYLSPKDISEGKGVGVKPELIKFKPN